MLNALSNNTPPVTKNGVYNLLDSKNIYCFALRVCANLFLIGLLPLELYIHIVYSSSLTFSGLGCSSHFAMHFLFFVPTPIVSPFDF